jgi:phosphatidylserine/phosphatidylglycerophosphate/cardiolipin synthase-like enzyme
VCSSDLLRIRHTGAARVYLDVFEIDWALASPHKVLGGSQEVTQRRYTVPFQLVNSPGDTVRFFPTMSPRGMIPDTTLWDEKHIVGLIDSARSEVMLQFLSYSPISRDKQYYPALNDALVRAGARGIRVRMIVADWEKGSEGEKWLKELGQQPNVEIKYSAIPEWSGGYISFARVEHCKFVVADGARFWLGTSNGEKSYFSTSRNLGVIVTNSALAAQLRNIFMKSWDGPYCETIRPDGIYPPRQHGER